MFKIKNWWPIIIFFLALAIRLIYVLPLDPAQTSADSGQWRAYAINITEGRGFGQAWRPPLYVFFLAGIYTAFGKGILAVRIIQAIVGALTCIIVYFIAQKLFKIFWISLVSSLMAAFYPYLIYYSGDILCETLLTFFIGLSILTLLLVQEKPVTVRIITAGIVLGLTALTKPVILPFSFLVMGWIMLTFNLPWLAKLKMCFFMLVFIGLTILPWTVRNYFYYQRFILISTGGASLWQSYNPEVDRLERLAEILSQEELNQDALSPNFEWYPAQRFEEISKLPRIEADKIFTAEAWSFMKNNKGKVWWLWWKRFLHYWRLYPIVATKKNKIIAMLTSGLILPLGWIGLILSVREYWRKTLLLILLFLSFTIVYCFFLPSIRYRVPLDAYFGILASYTLFKIGRHTCLPAGRKVPPIRLERVS